MNRMFWKRLRLNFRAFRLAVLGDWLRNKDIAQSYDSIAATYDDRWLMHLQSTTDRLHRLLTDQCPNANRILELGCGSGYSTLRLREHYPESSISAVDISSGMIDKAKSRLDEFENPVDFFCDDMLGLLKRIPSSRYDMIFSGWAIGYSNPPKIIAESARILKPGGILAVIVNRLDTMPAVFDIFRHTMRQFPETLAKAVWPRFPKDKSTIALQLKKHDFHIERIEEGAASIRKPTKNRFDWILGTGVLAGFDNVLPLRDDGPVRDFFAEKLDEIEIGWEHRYILFIARKKN